jgi:hypothetical protein
MFAPPPAIGTFSANSGILHLAMAVMPAAPDIGTSSANGQTLFPNAQLSRWVRRL